MSEKQICLSHHDCLTGGGGIMPPLVQGYEVRAKFQQLPFPKKAFWRAGVVDKQ